MAITASGIGTAAGLLGTAVQDLFSAKGNDATKGGDLASAASYDEAALIARQNQDIVRQSTDIQVQQTTRQIFKTIGTQRADVAGAGFAESGSALDLLRDSGSQGALSKALLQQQGIIQENAYAEQAGAFTGMANAARAAGSAAGAASTGAEIGGAISAVGAIATVASFFFN